VKKLGDSISTKRAETAKRFGVSVEYLPRHIAIIMDGNGRWAQKKGLPRYEGHREGGKTVEKIVKYCVDLGIECLTLYSFSMQNWKRPNGEINFLMQLYRRYLTEIRPLLMRNNVRLVHLGRTEGYLGRLPDSVVEALSQTVKMTEKNNGMVLGLALNYGSRTEIVDATKKIAQEYKNGRLMPADIDEQCISEHLYTAGLLEPDLLIRTAGEMRVSNFLLWQISYAEFYVTRTMWPDVGKATLDRAIKSYAGRERRFGGVRDGIGDGVKKN